MNSEFNFIPEDQMKALNFDAKKPVQCPFEGCTRTYSTKYSMWRHLSTHNPNRQFECLYCKKRFALAQYLKDHYHVHTGAKPYKCDFPGCGQGFSQTGKLSQHKK